MEHRNQMNVWGRTTNNTSAVLKINLADDKTEVRGYGQPVTADAAKKMADDYFRQCKAAWSMIQTIKADPAYNNLVSLPGFAEMETLIDPSNQIVSGVFGKEIILQIISQKGCEGIRYVHGKDKKNTIILFGVKETGEIIEYINGVKHSTSEAISFATNEEGDIPVIAEVHEDGKTIEEVEGMMANLNKTKSTDITFGIF